MDYATEIPTHPSTQYRYALGIRFSDASRTLGRFSDARTLLGSPGRFSDASGIVESVSSSLTQLRDARKKFRPVPATPKKPAFSVLHVSYLYIMGMTYAYDRYAIRAVRNRSDPRHRYVYEAGKRVFYVVVGFRRKQNTYSNTGALYIMYIYNLYYYGLLKSIYCVDSEYITTDRFTLAHIWHTPVLCIPVLSTLN
jgi:hypothetical protein